MPFHTPEHDNELDGGGQLQHTTLGLYGHTLPIGVYDGTTLHKGFAFRRFTYAAEMEVAKLKRRKNGPGDHPAKVATEVLAYMLTEWGGDTSFSDKQHAHKLTALRAAYMEDFLYAWVALRVEAMGEELAIASTCGSCRHEHTWYTDLEELKLTVSDAVPDPVRLDLKSPFDWGKAKLVALELEPPRWASVCAVSAQDRNNGLDNVKHSIVTGAMRCALTADGEQVPVAPRVLEMLHKRDVERVAGALDSADFPRSELVFEIVCPACGSVEKTSLDWTWGFFFGSVSLRSE